MAIKNVNFDKVSVTGGFWKKRAELNNTVSIYAVKKRFEDSGRFDAVRFIEGNENIHVYYDSDVAKWIEAVAYIAYKDKKKYAELIDFCDELIAKMVENQREDGYFNSYFQQKEPTEIFKRRNDHELYCAGHIIEAAVAYDKYLGKNELLKLAERYVKLIRKAFMIDKTAGFYTCGHEEIELALFKLYEYTGNIEYRELAEFFVNQRGNNDKDAIVLTKQSFQDNLPARDLSEAEGHAVRAMYYYCAMADMARISDDEDLKKACLRLFDNITREKMYVTGGLGSTRLGESFTKGFDLPNSTAYCESCAGIGFVMFCQRLNELGIDGTFADVIERVLFNVFMSSTSLDGKSFFYENPLEICRKEKGKETAVPENRQPVLPIWRRQEVFNCSCCPPNINRFSASLGGLAFTQTDDGIYLNQYISCKYEGVTVKTEYPNLGTVNISGNGYGYGKFYVRIPAWCDDYSIIVDGKAIKAKVYKGYAEICVKDTFEIELKLNFTPKFIECNPKVRDNAGKVCLVNGPIVYCLEEVDNGEDLYALAVDKNVKEFKAEYNEKYNASTFTVKGIRKIYDDRLYADSFETRETELKFIPYFAFANREESDMLVWIKSIN